MQALINLDDSLLARALEVTGLTETDDLVRFALKNVIAQKAARELAKMGGSDPDAWIPSRRRGPE